MASHLTHRWALTPTPVAAALVQGRRQKNFQGWVARKKGRKIAKKIKK